MMHGSRVLGIVCLCATAATAGAQSPAERRPFGPRDLWELQRVGAPAASPDGRQVAYELRTTDFAANRLRADLWIAPLDGGSPRRLTSHEANETSPAWSRDGRHVYFLSSRSGSSQVWRIAVDGGEAEPITDLPVDVGGFLLSPDGSTLALAIEVFVECADLECTAARLEERNADKSSVLTYDVGFVRHWDSWKDGRRSHVFVVPIGVGEPIDVMKGIDADSPTKPFGGMEEVAFTPDGRGLVFAARVAGKSEPWSTNVDLWFAPVDGSVAPRNLTASNPAWDSAPSFSPDGKTLAYVAMARPGYESDRLRVVLRGWPEGDSRVLTEGWDRSVPSVSWSADGATLYAAVEDTGHSALFAIDVETGKPRALLPTGHVRWPQPAGDRILFGRDDFRSPVDLYSVRKDGSDLRKVTDVNGARLASLALGDAEQFQFEGAGGDRVHGWVVKPANFDPARKYPVAYLIHGGPQGSWSNDFHYRWNPQTYAGRGYAAVMVDFHGSTGYGQAFTDAIRGDWGGKPLADLDLGLEAVLRKYPWMDGTRVCALGASYGGYMVNWIAGNRPDRYRCLVSHSGIVDTAANWYSTEELWFPEWEFGGAPWEAPETYERWNPAKFTDRWKTPMLVIHGERDYRVPVTQGLAAFNVLQRRGVPSRLLVYPDENHWILKPANGLRWHDEVLGWLDRWTQGGTAP